MPKTILSSVDIQYLFFVKKQYKIIAAQIKNYARKKIDFKKNGIISKMSRIKKLLVSKLET
ncbi:MAG: hypothetical protein R6U40_02210 [Desulfobacterales bacterium]